MKRLWFEKRAGVTLAETLLAIGIFTLLLSLLMPAIQRIRDLSARQACGSNLRQMGLALHSFHTDHGRLPPVPWHANPDWMTPSTLLNWPAQILPYVENSGLYAAAIEACRVQPITFLNPPHVGNETIIKLYICPNDPRLLSAQLDLDGYFAAYTSYLGVSGGLRHDDGVMLRNGFGLSFAAIRDGLSFTLLAGERPPPDNWLAGRWYSRVKHAGSIGSLGPDWGMGVQEFGVYGPGRTDNPADRFHFWSLHLGGANFVFADASVRFLPYRMREALVPLATRDGGEPITELE